MMYIHYCRACSHIHILNGHKMNCPRCDGPLTELLISYLEYVNLSQQERDEFLEKCRDGEQLKSLSTTYRMYKYSKWYKELQKSQELQSATGF